MCEVGVRWGGSIRLWLDYLPITHLIGYDTDPKVVESNVSINDPRYIFLLADAYTNRRRKVMKPNSYDLIIDDGPHSLPSQVYAANRFIKYLNKNGLLVIEDILNYDHIPLIIASAPLKFRGDIYIMDLRELSKSDDSVLIIFFNSSGNEQVVSNIPNLRKFKSDPTKKFIDSIKSRYILFILFLSKANRYIWAKITK